MRAALIVAVLAAGLGGCVNTPVGDTPDWADATGYPRLRDVPTGGTSANTAAAHWQAGEADLLAARDAARDNPRAQAATAQDDPEQFLEEARRELEETRASHNPY
jgi:hypothetical protein